jgi:hypothetical protein
VKPHIHHEDWGVCGVWAITEPSDPLNAVAWGNSIPELAAKYREHLRLTAIIQNSWEIDLGR